MEKMQMNFEETKSFKKCHVKHEMNPKYSSRRKKNVQESNSISLKAQLIYVTLNKSYKINPENAILCDREKRDTRKVEICFNNSISPQQMEFIYPGIFFAVCGMAGEYIG